MMSTRSKQFPCTLSYIAELLSLSEDQVLALAQRCGLSPTQDDATQTLYFDTGSVEQIRQAALNGNLNTLSQNDMIYVSTADDMHEPAALTTEPMAPVAAMPLDASVNTLWEAVATLLDQKLSGLDELLETLVKSRLECETHRQKVTALQLENKAMQRRLDAFTPVGFGFYRKKKPYKT